MRYKLQSLDELYACLGRVPDEIRVEVERGLAVTAETESGLIMGMAHRTLPIHGVQFHPESIASEHGHRLLGNFLKLAGLNAPARAAA